MVQFSSLAIEARIKQHGVEVAEEVEHAVVRVGRVELDQRVNQPDAGRMGHQQERPKRDAPPCKHSTIKPTSAR